MDGHNIECIRNSHFGLAEIYTDPTTHFMQAIWSQVLSLGLAEEYRSNDLTLKQFVQKMATVTLCTPFQ